MNGQSYHDDLTVPNDSYVLRRIPQHAHIFDHKVGKRRPNSGNFDDDSEGLPCSVVLSVVLQDLNREDLSVLDEHPDFLLVKISVSVIRNLELGVERAPTEDEPAHGHITGKKTRSKKGKLATAAEWVVPPSETNPSL